MLQLISVDSRHFTQPELSPRLSDLHKKKTLVLAYLGRIRHVTFVKVAPLLHVGKLKHLVAFIPP